MTEYFYNATTGKLHTVLDAWPEDVKDVYTFMLRSGGYKPVSNYYRPKSEAPFAILEAVYIDRADHYEMDYQETPCVIELSQQKLLLHPVIRPRLRELSTLLSGSPDLTRWLLDETTYLRGSPMASLAMQAFGLSQERLETIVKDCMK